MTTTSLQSLRANVVVVPQQPFLFSGDLLANIRLASPHASLVEVQQACDRLVVLAEGRLVREGTTDDILRGHRPTDWKIRIEPDEVDRAISALLDARLDIVASDTAEVTIALPDGWTGRDLNQALVRSDVFASELVPHRVTLEEAFLAMTAPAPADQAGARQLEGATHAIR